MPELLISSALQTSQSCEQPALDTARLRQPSWPAHPPPQAATMTGPASQEPSPGAGGRRAGVQGPLLTYPPCLGDSDCLSSTLSKYVKRSSSASGYIQKRTESQDCNGYLHARVHGSSMHATAKKWKQSKCPSTDEWINKTCSTHTINITQPSKGRKFSHATTWMNPEHDAK